jgi:hypothetical protein
MWNIATSTWSALGTGLGGICQALAFGINGLLYAGGQFTTVNNTSTGANYVGFWNGTTWSALTQGGSQGLNSYCQTIAVSQRTGIVYVGGWFTTAGGFAIRRIARWNPFTSTWGLVGGDLNAVCYSIVIDSNDILYAGGAFTTANYDNVTVNYVGRWDGSTWTGLGSPAGVAGSGAYISDVCIGPNNDLYVSGAFSSAGGISINNIARWNGTTWSGLGTSISPTVMFLAPSNSLYVGAYNLFADIQVYFTQVLGSLQNNQTAITKYGFTTYGASFSAVSYNSRWYFITKNP